MGYPARSLLPTRPGQRLMDGLWDLMDLSGLREQDADYARVVFSLLMAALGSAFMDAMLRPENWQECRNELVMKLEIVRYGCLKEAASGRNEKSS